ncbi:MAG: CHAT domain-containing protein [Leptolyngbya sp. RL_3_1]|nr:CHAT domain-containing protein [Leptolyngbya sp. RL_3_1]
MTSATSLFTDGFNILAAAVTEDRSVDLLSGDTLFFPGLTFAGQEVSTLAALIPGTDQRLNNDFSTDLRLEFNDYAIIHLATHATFRPGVPEESFILFGDGRADLTEIKNTWSFPNVDLVVLSACETGVGDELGDGTEILGFGYLMQLAGADAAIASLWKVSDPGTQVFMTRFYQALQGGAAKAKALQTAQLALIDPDTGGSAGEDRASARPTLLDGRTLEANALPGYSHPYYWAPFILIGNGL